VRNNGGHRVVDHFVWSLGGQRRHAAIFVKDGITEFHAPTGFTSADFDRFVAARKAEGFQPVGINGENAAGTRFGGIFLKDPGTWVVEKRILGPDAYQAKFDEQTALGRRLHRVQGYDNGNKFAAIWTAPPFFAPWVAGKAYAVGDKVTYNGIVYEVRQAHTSQPQWAPPLVPALFQRPTPVGSSPWAPNVAYVVGSLVTYNGATYRAIQAHTSLVGWDPPFTPALWTLVP
jgi:hypothetical protein